MSTRIFSKVILILILSSHYLITYAQPTWAVNVVDSEIANKPKKFEMHQLVSEKMLPKKPTKVREFFENTFTHYNYYYDANVKINFVIERAKAAQVDDYTKLLPFYSFTLQNAASQKRELDSVILKATAGILLHDLRNDWIDNMYLLLGEAYFYKMQFDTAQITFQFINYNLFPRKNKNDDDNQIVGTRDLAANGALSIATKEKQNFLQKKTALPPSRNDALIWLVKTLIVQQKFAEAGGIINTLQYDANLPLRLQNDLEEVDAFLFYQQGNYDSCAVHLEGALSNATTNEDKARWEFLLAQMYELTHQYHKATFNYNKAASHTVNPLMNIYAQLNNAKMRRSIIRDSLGLAKIDSVIYTLSHMSKKDKFEPYRDILYYSSGVLAIAKPDTTEAIDFFKKSVKYTHNIGYKNKALISLGDIAFNQKEYKLAYNYYDSLQTDTSKDERYIRAQLRAKDLKKIVAIIDVINMEDSLQQLAQLQPASIDSAVKKELKRLRKIKGLKGDDIAVNDGNTTPVIGFGNSSNQPVDMFGTNNSKGDWYFYNTALKSQGYTDFKTKWGNRTNMDNWRRKGTVSNLISALSNPDDTTAIAIIDTLQNSGSLLIPLSYDGLLSTIPLTTEKLNISNKIWSDSIFSLGKIFQNDLEDYSEASNTYEKSLRQFPDSLHNGNLYFNLIYCYYKLGMNDKAAYYKQLLTNKFPTSHAAILLTNPAAAEPLKKNQAVSARYQNIYNLFIEGNFETAIAEKIKADSLYGNSYWTPQLLYIESIYQIKVRCDDSAATSALKSIIKLYPTSALVPRAIKMMDVLRRRNEIESYLTKLQVTRAKEDETIKIPEDGKTIIEVASKAPDSIKTILPTIVKKDNTQLVKQISPKDSVLNKVLVPILPTVDLTHFSFIPTSVYYVIMVLDKVDNTYASEARNAFMRYNDEVFYDKQYSVEKMGIDKEHAMLVISSFANEADGLQYLDKIKLAAQSEVSWLPASKYYFEIISDESLQLLKFNKDISGYTNLFKIHYHK